MQTFPKHHNTVVELINEIFCDSSTLNTHILSSVDKDIQINPNNFKYIVSPN